MLCSRPRQLRLCRMRCGASSCAGTGKRKTLRTAWSRAPIPRRRQQSVPQSGGMSGHLVHLPMRSESKARGARPFLLPSSGRTKCPPSLLPRSSPPTAPVRRICRRWRRRFPARNQKSARRPTTTPRAASGAISLRYAVLGRASSLSRLTPFTTRVVVTSPVVKV